MLTYQDFKAVGENEEKRKAFVRMLINEHKSSQDYGIARDAYEYYCHKNVTIRAFQKVLYKVTGEAVPDYCSPNFKMACRHFKRFIVQEVSHLLGNGVSWDDESTEGMLGVKGKSFDRAVTDAATKALWGMVSFGFFNKDHVDVFSILEFAPLYDEMDGSLKAGVRFWQIDETKPLRATLYEIEGYTKYVWDIENESTKDDTERTAYLQTIASTDADGDEIIDGKNYPTFPIVPLWANPEHQSEIVGLREQIDCYDLIKSGFANTVDEASLIYWTINNAGGMDDIDLANFIDRIRTIHAATVDDNGASAESHAIEAPWQSREKLLDRLDKDLYKDAMALDTERIAAGATTATQIRASYEDLDHKCDEFEYQVIDFIDGILKVAGIEDEPTFTRSQIINQTELIEVLIQAAPYLSEDYVTKKILEILGDGDRTEQMLEDIDADDMKRITTEPEDEPAEE